MTNKSLSLTALVIMFMIGMMACQKPAEEGDAQDATQEGVSEDASSNKGQAFIEGDQSTPNVLQVAMSSPDHTTLVAAIQAAELENSLVNAGPFTVFAPTNAAFDALPEGTVENLLKPENKDALANILKYHVTPGNLSIAILTKLPKVGQANNLNVPIEVVDGKPVIGGANIVATVPAGNGVVHVIDKVLLPPSN